MTIKISKDKTEKTLQIDAIHFNKEDGIITLYKNSGVSFIHPHEYDWFRVF
jgi:hypothetical protein